MHGPHTHWAHKHGDVILNGFRFQPNFFQYAVLAGYGGDIAGSDAAPVAADWASASIGAAYRFSSRLMLRGAASAAFFNPEMISYGGELGLSVSFYVGLSRTILTASSLTVANVGLRW